MAVNVFEPIFLAFAAKAFESVILKGEPVTEMGIELEAGLELEENKLKPLEKQVIHRLSVKSLGQISSRVKEVAEGLDVLEDFLNGKTLRQEEVELIHPDIHQIFAKALFISTTLKRGLSSNCPKCGNRSTQINWDLKQVECCNPECKHTWAVKPEFLFQKIRQDSQPKTIN